MGVDYTPIINENYLKDKETARFLIDLLLINDEEIYQLIDLAEYYNLNIIDILSGKVDESIIELLKAKMAIDGVNGYSLRDISEMEEVEEKIEKKKNKKEKCKVVQLHKNNDKN